MHIMSHHHEMGFIFLFPPIIVWKLKKKRPVFGSFMSCNAIRLITGEFILFSYLYFTELQHPNAAATEKPTLKKQKTKTIFILLWFDPLSASP